MKKRSLYTNNSAYINKLYKKVLIGAFCLINIYFVQALQITEILYDPEGNDANREWIEVYNDNDKDENLLNYKFYYEGDCKLKTILKDKGNDILHTGEYVIIVLGNNADSFKIDYPDFDGNLFVTGYSSGSSGVLRNSTTTSSSIKDHKGVGLCNSSIIKEEYNFVGDSKNAGESYNLFFNENKEKVEANSYIPTPGKPNNKINKNNNSSSPTVDEKADYLVYKSGYNPRSYTVGDIKIESPREVFGVAGGYTFFPTRITNSKNEILKSDVIWSMGDGVEIATTSPEYVYKNPGNYMAIIEAVTIDRVYAIERVKVKIDKPDIIIDSFNIDTSDDSQAFISLYNNSQEELDIGNFIISCDWERYQLSKHLILNPKETFYLYNNILNFNCLRQETFNGKKIQLFLPNSLFLTEYKNKVINMLSADLAKTHKTISTNFVKSSANLANKVVYTSNTSIDNNVYKANPSIIAVSQSVNDTNNVQVDTDSSDNKMNSDISVDKSESFWKKLLYFLYE